MEENIRKKRITNEEIFALMTSLVSRFDEMDLNGAAKHLREFGYFLRDNPDYLPRARKAAEEAEDWEVVQRWIDRKFGWVKRPKTWAAGFIVFLAMGVGYALGSSVVTGLSKAIPPILPHIKFGN